MKVFLSWSGTQSKKVAEALRLWLPRIIQSVGVFFSERDIEKGENWALRLSRELSTCDFGILCLTRDNMASPWLLYEAGALAQTFSSRVSCLLLDMERGALRGPLSHFQATLPDKQELLALLHSVNHAAGSPLSPEALRDAFELHWENGFQADLERAVGQPAPPAAPVPLPDLLFATELSGADDEVVRRLGDIPLRGIRMMEFSGHNAMSFLRLLGSRGLITEKTRIQMLIACPRVVPSEHQILKMSGVLSSLISGRSRLFLTYASNSEIRFYNFERHNYPSLRGRDFDGRALQLGWYTYDSEPKVDDRYQVAGHENPMLVHTVAGAGDFLLQTYGERFDNHWAEAFSAAALLERCQACELSGCTASKTLETLTKR